MATMETYHLIAMLCTAMIYFMNFEANLKGADPNNHPAEDAALGIDDERKKKYADKVRAQGGHDRWLRISLNQLENFPFHIWVYWGALMAGGDPSSVAGSFVAYMAFRVLFVFCYIYSLMPWRTLMFVASTACNLVASYQGISGALNSENVGGDKSFRVAGVSIVALFFALNFEARRRSINPNDHPAEDVVLLGPMEELKQAAKDAREQNGPGRWERIAVNQYELIPLSFSIYWGAFSVGANPATLTGIFVGWAVLRLLYIFFYVFSLQPFRSMTWGISNLTTFVTGVIGLSACSSATQALMMGSTFLLWVLHFLSIFKSVDPNNHPAEDSAIGLDDARKEAYAKRIEEQGGVDRWTRIAANQLENLPIHLAVLWGAATIAENKEPFGYCFAAYAVFRLIYIVCYLQGLQPWRTMFYLFSTVTILTTIVMATTHAGGLATAGITVVLLAVCMSSAGGF